MGLRELIAGALLVYGSSQIPVYAQDSAPEPPKPVPAVHEKGTEGVDRAVYEAPKSDEPVSRELKRWEKQLEALEVRVAKIEEKAEKRDEPPKYSKGLIGDYVALARWAEKHGLEKEAEQTYTRILEFDIRHKIARKALNLVIPYVDFYEAKDGNLEEKIACLRRIVKDDYGADCEFYFLTSDTNEYSRKEKRILEEQEKQALGEIIRILRERAEYKTLPYEAVEKAAKENLERIFSYDDEVYLFDEDANPCYNEKPILLFSSEILNLTEEEARKQIYYRDVLRQTHIKGIEVDGQKINLNNRLISQGIHIFIRHVHAHKKLFEKFGLEEKWVERALYNYAGCQHYLEWFEELYAAKMNSPWLDEANEQLKAFTANLRDFMASNNQQIIKVTDAESPFFDKYELRPLPKSDDVQTDAEKVSKK